MSAFRIFSRFAELLDINVTRAAAAWLRLNADGTVTERTAAQVLSDIGGAASSHEHTSAQISDATDAATPYMVVKRSASGSAAFDNYISAPTVQAGDTLTVGGMGAVRASNLTGGRNIELPNASGTLALTNSSTGLVNVDAGYVTGTLPVANGGTGAATAPLARAALGSGAAGDSIFVASTPPVANKVLWEYKTDSFTAVHGGHYICAGEITVTNPTTSNAGEYFVAIVLSGTVGICGSIRPVSTFPRVYAYSTSWGILEADIGPNPKFAGYITAGTTGSGYRVNNKGYMLADADGDWRFTKEASASFGRLSLGFGSTKGEKTTYGMVAETEVTATAAATITATNLIPAGSIVHGVTARVTKALTGDSGFTGFDIGDGSDQNAWGDNIAPEAGTTTDVSKFEITAVPIYKAATSIVLTQRGGSTFNAGGKVRLAVHYMTLTAPKS